MANQEPPMLKAALVSGAIFGFVAGLPGFELLNCACCSLMIGSGVLAAYLYAKDCRATGLFFGAARGATVGLISSLFYTIVTALIQAARRGLFGVPDPAEALEVMERLGVPPESLEIASRWVELMQGWIGMVFEFFFTLLLAAVFATIGGLIGGAAFKVEPPPPAAAPPLPPPAPPVVPS
jgi:hypothetical protein